MNSILLLIQNSIFSVYIRESVYLYPLIVIAHLMSLTLFFGIQLLLNLNILGFVFKKHPFIKLHQLTFLLKSVGAVIILTTGLILFFANPINNYYNYFFWLKIVFIVFGLGNAFLVHKKMKKDRTPLASTFFNAAIISTVIWMSVIFFSKMMVYSVYRF